MVPGHEIIGVVAAVGDEESQWKVGDRVGGGWHGGQDGKLMVTTDPKTEDHTADFICWVQGPATPVKRASFRCATIAW